MYLPSLYPVWNFLPGHHIYIASVVFSCSYFQHSHNIWPWWKSGKDKQLSTISCQEGFLLKAMWQFVTYKQIISTFQEIWKQDTEQLQLSHPPSLCLKRVCYLCTIRTLQTEYLPFLFPWFLSLRLKTLLQNFYIHL